MATGLGADAMRRADPIDRQSMDQGGSATSGGFRKEADRERARRSGRVFERSTKCIDQVPWTRQYLGRSPQVNCRKNEAFQLSTSPSPPRHAALLAALRILKPIRRD